MRIVIWNGWSNSMVTAGGFPACSYHKLTNFSTNQNFSIYFYPPPLSKRSYLCYNSAGYKTDKINRNTENGRKIF